MRRVVENVGHDLGKIDISIVKILRHYDSQNDGHAATKPRSKSALFLQRFNRLSYSNLPSEHLATRLRDLGLISSIEMGSLRKSCLSNEKFTDEILAELGR